MVVGLKNTPLDRQYEAYLHTKLDSLHAVVRSTKRIAQ